MWTDLSVQSLSAAITANLHEFFRYLQVSPATEYYEGEGLARWRTPVPHAWLNGVLCSRPPRADEGPLIADTVAYFRGRDVPLCSWWLEPQLAWVDWERQLARRGFRCDRTTPGMAADLCGLPPDVGMVAGLQVVTVQDEATLGTWARTLLAGFGLPPSWEPGCLALFRGLGLEPPMRHYVGYLHRQPVAAATLFTAAGVAGLQYLATVAEARGKGIGRTVALVALHEARAMGYRAAVLQSSEMGYNLYLQLGFRTLDHIRYFYHQR